MLLFVVPPQQNFVIDRFRYASPQSFASHVVGAEVLACEDAADSCFLRSSGEAGEVARHAGQRLRSDIEGERIAKERAQHRCARFADGTMRSRVGRFRSSLDA